MEGLFVSKILTVFGAGLLTSLSPCVYPMIPISLGHFAREAKSGSKLGVVLFFAGQVLTFTALGIIAATLGEIFGFSSESPWVMGIVGIFLVVFGLCSWFDFVPKIFQLGNQMQFNRFKGGFLFPILVGAGSALVASPCTTPVLGAVLITISSTGQLALGSLYMFVYALGATLIFLILGLGIVSAKVLPGSGAWMAKIHKTGAVLIFATGIYFLYTFAVNL